MNFAEVDLFGVYVAPISLIMVAAWLVLIALRRAADHFGLLRHVWHPALFCSLATRSLSRPSYCRTLRYADVER